MNSISYSIALDNNSYIHSAWKWITSFTICTLIKRLFSQLIVHKMCCYFHVKNSWKDWHSNSLNPKSMAWLLFPFHFSLSYLLLFIIIILPSLLFLTHFPHPKITSYKEAITALEDVQNFLENHDYISTSIAYIGSAVDAITSFKVT